MWSWPLNNHLQHLNNYWIVMIRAYPFGSALHCSPRFVPCSGLPFRSHHAFCPNFPRVPSFTYSSRAITTSFYPALWAAWFIVGRSALTSPSLHVGNELHIHEVHPRDEETFRLLYDEKIPVQGTSVRDVLRQFDEMPLIINYGLPPLVYFEVSFT